jgi:hypothetical protein
VRECLHQLTSSFFHFLFHLGPTGWGHPYSG